MELLIFIVVAWVVPILAGHSIGKSKNRAGWAWGLILGWLGVIIVALLPSRKPSVVPGLAERQRQLAQERGTAAPRLKDDAARRAAVRERLESFSRR